MRNIKYLMGFLLLVLSALPVLADKTDETKKQINNVKKSTLYLYGEATAATEVEAKDLAEEILYEEINKWAATKKKLRGTENFVLNNKKELFTTLSLRRGNMFRSFVYVKKTDIQKADNVTVMTPISSVSQNLEVQAQEKVESQVEELGLVESSDSEIAGTRYTKSKYPEIINELAAISDYKTLAEKIMQAKKEGKIRHYARYAQLENPDIYWLAIYNKQGQVLSLMIPGPLRVNVKTAEPDFVTNYSGCGAIGFTINE